MSDQTALYQWTQIVRERFGHLSTPQVRVLALWSLGMVLAHSCALTAVSLLWATGQQRKENTVRQQLREWCYDAADKRGRQRQALAVETCFVPLLAWVLSWWRGTHLALALDATSLGERFVVLAVSVLYRGCAIPVAWVVLPAATKHAWKHEWLRLVRRLQPAVPPQMTVIVLADRGRYARWLFRRLVRLRWHPLLRVNLGGTFRPAGAARCLPLARFAPQVGATWSGRGTAFASCPLACTLLATWEPGCATPWLLLTDLPPEAADASWYGVRAWIEQGFKVTKRGGWQWQRTQMTDPARAARLWLAVAVATLWLLSVGGLAEDALAVPDGTLLDLTAVLAQGRRQRRATHVRLVSCFRRGAMVILWALLTAAPLPTGAFVPEPWPTALDRALTGTREQRRVA